MPGQELGAPAGEARPKPAHLGRSVQLADGDRLVDQQLRRVDALGQVDVALQDFAVGIAEAKAQEHAINATRIQAFGAGTA